MPVLKPTRSVMPSSWDSPSPTKSCTELRATLEGFAARHAARRVKFGADCSPLLSCFRKMNQATMESDYRSFAEIDRQLHRTIAELADVNGLLPAWEAAFAAQEPFRIKTIETCWPDMIVLFESHRPLVDAIAIGNEEEAEEAALTHLNAVWFRLAIATGDGLLGDDPLDRACAYLAFHFQERVQLEDLARTISHCSPGHLARLFRDQLGLTYSDYLIELRLQRAASLLQSSERSVREIAGDVGYLDASRFAMHFRRRFGESPSRFRNRFHR